MKRHSLILLATLSIMLLLSPAAKADEINGYMIPEYYYVANHHDGETGIEGQHGLWLRRIYFGYDSDLGKGWSARLRFEMNSTAFKSDSIIPYVKNLHVKKELSDGLSILAGIIDPPSFDKIEKFWDLRHIEKTPADFFKFASSRDFGIALDGKTKNGIVYTLMVGNYSSNKSESNKGKAIYARLGWETEKIYLEVNTHYASESPVKTTFLSLFGGLKGEWGRLGVGYNYRNNKPKTGENVDNGIISAFTVVKINKDMNAFARYDHLTDVNFGDIAEYVPVPAKSFKARFLITGLEFQLYKAVKLSPNVKYVFYAENAAGLKPKGDFYINLTGHISFKSKIL